MLEDCSKTERPLFHRSGRWWIQRNHQNARNSWTALPCKQGTKKHCEEWWIQHDSKDKASMHRGGSMSPRESVWIHLFRKIHEDHNSMSHCNLVHKFIPMPQGMKIRDAKAAVDREWKKLQTIPAWQLDKVEVILEAQKELTTVHFYYSNWHLSSQKMRS